MTLNDLTEREREVAELVAQGLSCSQIGRQLVNLRVRGKEGIAGSSVRQAIARIATRIGPDASRPYLRVMRWTIEQQVRAA